MAKICGHAGSRGRNRVCFALAPCARERKGDPTTYEVSFDIDGSSQLQRLLTVSSFSGHVKFLDLANLLISAELLVDSSAVCKVHDRVRCRRQQSQKAPNLEFNLQWLPESRIFQFSFAVMDALKGDIEKRLVARMIGCQLIAPVEDILAFGRALLAEVIAAKERDWEFWKALDEDSY
jgi:hypothetical protein